MRKAVADPWRRPVLVTGIGLGAFLDGIVFHQVLQWHHLVVGYRAADDLAGLQYNTFWDGIFHVAAWLTLAIGLVWLVRVNPRRGHIGARGLLAWALIGWGSFNLADQVVFHMILGAHHIRMVESYQVYDAAYTALGALLVASGLALGRRAQVRDPR